MKLTELLEKYDLNGDFINNGYDVGGTDKNTCHSYVDSFYEKEFETFKEKNISILEIGIETGGSLKLWKEYFSNSKSVVGIDIDDSKIDPKYKEIDGVTMHFNDAYDSEFVSSLEDFDIIIDDGPHTIESQVKFIELYLPKLKKGGLFIIEDVQKEEHFNTLIQRSKEVCDSIDNDLEYVVECIDLRDRKNRWDDLLFLIRS